RPCPHYRPSGLRPVGRTAVGVVLVARVLGGAAVVYRATEARRTRAVVGVARCTFTVVAVCGCVVVVDVVVVVGADEVVVSTTVVGAEGSVPRAAALSERWMAGSPPRWG